MKLTKRGEYAMWLLPAMAQRSESWKAVELSRRTGVPLTYTQIILRKLASGGVLVSERGRAGGYRLAANAPTVRLLHVIELFEGESFAIPNHKPMFLHVVNAALNRAVTGGLTMTVAELIKCYQEEVVTAA